MTQTIDKCNVKSVFLQNHELDREEYIQPPKEAQVKKGQLWRLKVALYGLNDANLQFFIKSKKILLELGCEQSKIDPTLFYKRNKKGELIGLICTHVDDYIHCGMEEFQTTDIEKLVTLFKMGKTKSKIFE